jgi:hypothetical protein
MAHLTQVRVMKRLDLRSMTSGTTLEYQGGMRSSNIARLLPLLVATVGLAACAAPAADDGTAESQRVTGGNSSIESPVAFLFDTAATDVAPKCAGAMIADTFAVTAKSCAKVGLIVGRAGDKAGFGERAKVVKVHTPTTAGADIAVVELDRELTGTNALITHMPLRSGYAVNAFAATDGKGLFSANKNEGSTVKASMTYETATHGTVFPVAGSEICDGDLGAPVCSSTDFAVGSLNLFGTCGLAGLVVAREAAAPAAPTTAAPTTTTTVTTPAKAAATSCSSAGWQVAQLGQYADFLKKFAPKAFQPWFIDKPFLRDYPYYTPDGLWGYKTAGQIKTCTIDAASSSSIADTQIGTDSPKLRATVSFAAMDTNAAAWGRFGIAPKSDPSKMRWLPAAKLGKETGTAFVSSFEGVVRADALGDYVVAFRASANGGETWTTCDTDGAANGFQASKALTLKIVETAPTTPGTTPTTPTPGTTPTTPGTTPQDAPSSSASGGTYADPPAESGSTSNGAGETDPAPVAKKSAASAQGCSMGPATPLGRSSQLPVVGVLLGLAALVRRRRAV